MSKKFISVVLVVGTGVLFSLSAFSQSAEKPKQATSAVVPTSGNSAQISDLAPIQPEKAFVIGDNGEKIYFLTDPNKKPEQKNEADKKENAAHAPAPKAVDETNKPK